MFPTKVLLIYQNVCILSSRWSIIDDRWPPLCKLMAVIHLRGSADVISCQSAA